MALVPSSQPLLKHTNTTILPNNLLPPPDIPSTAEPRTANSGATAASLAGVNKMMTSLVKGSLVDFPIALTEGLNNVPLMYGEKVRKRKPITDWKSGSKEAGKNFVNGFADPIWCLFKQPAVGLTKHGGLGVFTGLGKAGMGLVVKPGSGKQSKPFYLITPSTYMHFIRRFISLPSSLLLANRSTLFF
jgi:hypothetical protein